MTLRNAINNISTSITCFYDEDFIALPERGVVQIDSEYIAYTSKSLQSLEGCIRGYYESETSTHDAGRKITFVPRGTFLDGTYYIKYTAYPRIDYEITTHNLRTANGTNWLDVHPFANLKSNKIIQIMIIYY